MRDPKQTHERNSCQRIKPKRSWGEEWKYNSLQGWKVKIWPKAEAVSSDLDRPSGE